MARRKGFLGFFDRLLDVITGRQEPKRRATTRETGEFRRGKQKSSRVAEQYARDRRDAYEQQLARRRQRYAEQKERRERAERPYRREWRNAGQADNDYARHWRIFNQLPLGDDITDEEKEQLWRSYVENMVVGRGYPYNDPFHNPFWSDLGMAPERFNWQEWRRARGYSKR